MTLSARPRPTKVARCSTRSTSRYRARPSGGGPTTRGTTSGRASARVNVVPDPPHPLPEFVSWPSFPFEGDLKVKRLDPAVDREPPREGEGEDADPCVACSAPDESYIWVSERWRVRAMDRPSGLPMVLILESRSHLD